MRSLQIYKVQPVLQLYCVLLPRASITPVTNLYLYICTEKKLGGRTDHEVDPGTG